MSLEDPTRIYYLIKVQDARNKNFVDSVAYYRVAHQALDAVFSSSSNQRCTKPAHDTDKFKKSPEISFRASHLFQENPQSRQAVFAALIQRLSQFQSLLARLGEFLD